MINFIEVTSVEMKYQSTEVFDLEVDVVHHYIANNFVVHNCTTSVQTGTHYAMASLIKDVVDVKWTIERAMEEAKALNINCKYQSVPFIVADGGFDNYDKIIKALALGADYVMVGKLFAQCEEACQKVQTIKCVSPDGYMSMHPELPKNLKWIYDDDEQFYISKFRLYYGMSTKRAQVETGNKTLKTAEGIEINVPVLYKLQGWCENFIDYLKSMMSYADSFNLTEFKEKAKYKIISSLEYLSFYK